MEAYLLVELLREPVALPSAHPQEPTDPGANHVPCPADTSLRIPIIVSV